MDGEDEMSSPQEKTFPEFCAFYTSKVQVPEDY